MNVKALEAKLQGTQEVAVKLDLLEEIAGHYYDRDDYISAVRFYGEAGGLAASDNTRAYYLGQKGICHYLLQEDVQAEEDLLASQRLSRPGAPDFNPEVHGLVHYFLGSLYEYRGENQASMKARREALEYLDHLPPEAQWMLLAGLSRNYEEKGDHRRAVDCNTRALSLIGEDDSEQACLYESLGINHYELGRYDEAQTYFSRVLEVAPDFERKDDIYVQIGLCCKRRLDYQMALDSYRKILELKKLRPEDDSLTWIHVEIASCLHHLKEYKQSIEAAQKALACGGSAEEMAEARSWLVNNHHALGQYELAILEGERALADSPAFRGLETMLPNLALSYYRLGDKQNFLRCREKCNRLFPGLSWTKHLNKLELFD